MTIHFSFVVKLYSSCLLRTESHILSTALQPAVDPCSPSPCGSNTQCHDGVCTCLPEYQGDPYAGCRPECILSTDCPRNRACIRNKCADPCPGTCGQGARCDVLNHIPICSCPEGFTGDPFILCRTVPRKKSVYNNNCNK